jgi:hypothetical protein
MEITGFDALSLCRFLFWTLYYAAAVFLVILLPGQILARKYSVKFGVFEKVFVYASVGIVLWLVQGLLFGLLHARWLSYGYVLFFLSYFLINIKRYKNTFHIIRKAIHVDPLIAGVFGIGIFGQIIQSIPSGFVFTRGWFTFIADDSIWHLGLTGSMIRDFPPMQAGMVGEPLTSYHFFANFFIGEFVRVFHMPLLSTQFLYTYTLFPVMLGSVMYFLLRRIGLNKYGALLGVYLQYFASDLIYLTAYLATGKMVFTIHPLEDGTMLLENPPRAFAMVLTVIGLLFFMHWHRSKKTFWACMAIISLGLVIGAKVNNGLMVIMGAMGLAGISILKRKWSTLAVAVGIGGLTYIIYSLIYEKSGGPVFAPFEMARMFVVQPFLGLSFLELRREIYLAHNNVLRVLQMNLTMLALFLFSQFGIRNFGWFGIKRLFKMGGFGIGTIILFGLVGTMGLATLFIQPIGFADIFNSYLAASVFLTIASAVFFERYLHKKFFWSFLIIFIVLTCTLPRFVYRMSGVAMRMANANPSILRSEFDAAKFIRQNSKPEDVIAVINTRSVDYFSSYVSALSNRHTYLSGQHYLSTFLIDYSKQMENIRILEKGTDKDKITSIIQTEPINYIYYYNDAPIEGIYGEKQIKKVYQAGGITIYAIENRPSV